MPFQLISRTRSARRPRWGLGTTPPSNGDIGALPELLQRHDRVTNVRDHDGAADHQADVERVHDLGGAPVGPYALDEVVVHAVVAAQHEGRGEAEQLLDLRGQRRVAVRRVVEGEEPLDAQVILCEDGRVGVHAKLLKGERAGWIFLW